MAEPEPADLDDPGAWVQRLEDKCRREAVEIRLRASAEAEEQATAALASANELLERRIVRLRDLRHDLADSSARIERDLVRAASEIMRRSTELAPPGNPDAWARLGDAYPPTS